VIASRLRPGPRAGGAHAAGVLAGVAIALGAPAVASAHGLSPTYQSPLPLAVYLVGAATTVGLSFLFVLARDMRAAPTDTGHVVAVPGWLRMALRAIGLTGWGWIMAQGIAGGSSDGAVAPLFLWIYGWVGIALITALLFPVWEWLDPFATLHDIGAWVLRRVGVQGWAPSELPDGARLWPAVIGFAFFVWLELVAVPGAQTLTIVLAGYTILSLALMAQFGRDTWRAGGETFTVWFRTLSRLAPYGVTPSTDEEADPDAVDERAVLRRPFASGLIDATWELPRIVLVALGTASIIFDGLSQTVAFASVFGAPALGPKTFILLAFLGLVVAAALAVAGLVSPGAIGAGLLPISVGYLVAHYLTYLLIDGQRILIAVSDPLQRGQDLFGTAFFEPSPNFLPAGLVWTVQLAAVVGGHMLGAWAGHVRAQLDIDEQTAIAREARDMRHRRVKGVARPDVRVREVPLAVMMVALTTLTLWSLGQAIVVEQAPEGAVPIVART
jgi:hypothetical protein